MPAGLDGNPGPIVTEARTEVIDHIADATQLDGGLTSRRWSQSWCSIAGWLFP